MTVESATYIDDLNPSYPAGTDQKSEGDNHIRLIKDVLQTTFPGITGAVTATQDELNLLAGTTITTTEQLNGPTLMTAVTSASGTYVDFTGVPAWAKRITVMVADLSSNGTSPLLLRIGDTSGIAVSNYFGGTGELSETEFTANNWGSAADLTVATTAGTEISGWATLTRLYNTMWAIAGNFSDQGGKARFIAGHKTLANEITTVRLTTLNGTDTFDKGYVNVLYE